MFPDMPHPILYQSVVSIKGLFSEFPSVMAFYWRERCLLLANVLYTSNPILTAFLIDWIKVMQPQKLNQNCCVIYSQSDCVTVI